MRALIIIAAAVIAIYYVYEGTFFEPAQPTCEQELAGCLRKCRRTATESQEAQACQAACQRTADECRARS